MSFEEFRELLGCIELLLDRFAQRHRDDGTPQVVRIKGLGLAVDRGAIGGGHKLGCARLGGGGRVAEKTALSNEFRYL